MIGLSSAEAEAYARELVTEDFDSPSTDNPERKLFDRVRADLDEAGVDLSDHRLHNKIAELRDEALRQVKSE